MATITELKVVLRKLKNLLYEEKEALLKNDGHKIAEIVELKSDLIEELKKLNGIDVSSSESVLELVKEIDSIQETNLLLTKQAIGYQEMLIESIAKNVNNLSNTYSPKGGYKAENNVNFIDQSI